MKIGICTGGGDCPGLNAVIRAAVRHGILNHNFEMYGIEESLNGLLCDKPQMRKLSLLDVAGIQDRGGTILGTSNKGSPFKGEKGEATKQKLLENWRKCGLDGLIIVGGDGTQNIAKTLYEAGMPILGIPKTIDNDYGPTELSIGFLTAVDVASEAISRLHSTAESHNRIMVVEVMGRDAGYVALYAGIAASANAILIPEIPYSYDAIAKTFESRRQRGRNFGIIVVAEGAFEVGKQPLFRSSATGTVHLGGVADEVARQMHERTNFDTRVTVLGHIQRGGAPISIDKIIATTYGVAALDLAANKQFGRVVRFKDGKISSISYEDIKERSCRLASSDPLIRTAESVGICLGR
jgi:6-phosphofructokinase 1